jgi:RHS repeat-associated protein
MIMDLDHWNYLERQRRGNLYSSPANRFANVLSTSGSFKYQSMHIFKKIHKLLALLSMCVLAICLLVSPLSAAASPLQSLIEEYGLTPHSITYDGPIGVKLPGGTLIIRYEVIRFGPSPFPLTLELGYDPESSVQNGLSPGWSLDGTPWHGYNIDWKTSWGDNSRMVSRTSDGGKTILYHYDAQGRLAAVSSNAGFGWEVMYDNHGHVQHIRDTVGREIKMHYTPAGHLSAVEFPEKKRFSYRYDKESRIKEIISPNGFPTQVSYDVKDRVTTLNGLTELTFRYKEHNDRYVVKTNQTNGPERTYQFDKSQKWASVAITDGPEITYLYDDLGRLIGLCDSLGRIESFRYDVAGNLIEHKDVAGGKTKIDYEGTYPVKITSPAGVITQIEYDEKGRRVRESDGLSREKTWNYDESGRVFSHFSNVLGTVRFEYSQEGHLIKETRPNGLVIRHRYDHQGRWIGSDNGFSRYGFGLSDDSFLKQISLNGVVQSVYEYDSLGRITDYTWLGRRFEYKWNDSSRLTQVTGPSGAVTQYHYDEKGGLTEMAPEGAIQRYFKMDTLGRVVWKDIGVSKTQFQYDRAGRPVHITNGRGQEIQFTTDPMDRLIKITGSDGAGGSLTYDTLGNLTKMWSPGFEQDFKYDKYGNVVEIRDSRFPEPVGFEYDNADRRTAIIVPGKGRIEYEYDTSDRLQSIRDISGGDIKLIYGANFQRKAVFYPNGVIVSYDHDAAGRMTGIRVEGPGGKRLAEVSYEYDRFGQPIRERDTKGLGWMVYLDRNGQIACIADGAGQITKLRYDERGNLLKAGPLSWAYDTSNRLVSTDKELFLYDDDGNLSIRQAHTRFNYEWDSLNRLTRIEAMASGTISYQYDLLDRRVSKKVGNKQIHFFIDNYDVLFEFDVNKEIRKLFLLGSEIDELFGVVIGDEIFYIIQDGMRNVRWITDVHGTLVGEFKYGLWGEVEGDSSILTKIGYGYRGRAYDAETGFYYFRARYYDPRLRRFISVDPDSGSVYIPLTRHPYLFHRNNPTLFDDPFGTREKYKTPFTRLLELPGRILSGGYEITKDALKAAYNATTYVCRGINRFANNPKKFAKEKFEQTGKWAGNKIHDTVHSAAETFQKGTSVMHSSPNRAYSAQGEELERCQNKRSPENVKELGKLVRFFNIGPTKLIRDAALAGSNPNDRERMKQIIKVYSEADKLLGDKLLELLKKPVTAFTKSELERVLKERFKTNLFTDGDLRYVVEKQIIPRLADKALKGAENLGKAMGAEIKKPGKGDAAAAVMAQKKTEDEARRRSEEQARKRAEEEAKKRAEEEARQKAIDDAVSKALAKKDEKDIVAKADRPDEPPEPPKPPETPPLPDDEVAGDDTGRGPDLTYADREYIKNKYGAEDVLGTSSGVFVLKDGQWMRLEEVRPDPGTSKVKEVGTSKDTKLTTEDDPTKDPLYASTQNLLEAKQLDRSGRQPIDYGRKPDQVGSDQSKKLKDMQAKLVKKKKEKHKRSSTESSKKTKPGVKVPPKKDDKPDDTPEGKMSGKYEYGCEIPESERWKYTGAMELDRIIYGDFEMTIHSDRKVTGSLKGYFLNDTNAYTANLTGHVDTAGNLHAVESRDGFIFKGTVSSTPKLSGSGDITSPKKTPAPYVCKSWWKSR